MIFTFFPFENQSEGVLRKIVKTKELFRLGSVNDSDILVMDTDEFDFILFYNFIQKKIYSLIENLNINNIEEISNQIKELFKGAILGETICHILMENIAGHNVNIKCVCVNGKIEDSVIVGKEMVFENVDFDIIPDKIIDCCFSVYSSENLRYFLKHDIEISKIKAIILIEVI